MNNNQKVSTAFGVGAILVLVAAFIVINNVKTEIVRAERDNEIAMSNILQRKNAKIRQLTEQLQQAQNNLTAVKSDLVTMSQKVETMVDATVQQEAAAPAEPTPAVPVMASK